jgi:hypothetical protein
VHLSKGRRNAGGEAQEASHLHRSAEEPAEQLTAGILEHQNGPTAVSLKRPHSPRAVQHTLERVFASRAIESGGCRLLRGWEYGQHAITLCGVTPPSAEGEPTVLRQDVKATKSARAESRRQFHLQTSPLSRGLADASLPPPSVTSTLASWHKLLEAMRRDGGWPA